MKVWLEGGTIKVNKAIMCQVTRYPTLDRPKNIRSAARNEIEKSTKAKWNA